eukprot:PLAT4313.1.p1 GENE.PLAT4313.1~~PLAT4313.1.p1  ORF type:complete len:338 (+),score=159.87 PLAT4313.1:124-1137(+)
MEAGSVGFALSLLKPVDLPAAVDTGVTIVTPGETVTLREDFMRGHGTRMSEDETELIATVAGVVERVNKLITVRPVKTRYVGEVGDVVIGRIAEVGEKRWRVDVGGLQFATLLLSSINLPGGVQRQRTYEDQLRIREFYAESDLVCAEVKKVSDEGSVSLHTRNFKYGKLQNGQFVQVPAGLIRRLKQHMHTLPCGVDIILGANGAVWISSFTFRRPSERKDGELEVAEEVERRRKLHAESVIDAETREIISRVRNSVVALAESFIAIHPESIMAVYSDSLTYGLPVPSMLTPEGLSLITSSARAAVEEERPAVLTESDVVISMDVEKLAEEYEADE